MDKVLISTEKGQLLAAKLNQTYGHGGDLGAALVQADAALAEHARYLSQFGISHRGFYVGGTAPVLMLEEQAQDVSFERLFQVGAPLGRIILLEGANNSPVKGTPRDCPELSMAACGNTLAREAGRAVFLHMYTAGPGSPEAIESVTGLRTPTLHPCDACRPRLQSCEATRPDMPITTQAYDAPFREDHTLEGLIEAYTGTVPPPASEALVALTAPY